MEMMEKVAYLKGLVEGLGMDNTTKEGKVLGLVIDLLDDVVLSISDIGQGFAIMGEQIESMDEDIEEIMNDLYEDEDDDEDECDCDHHHHHHHHGHHDMFEGELYEINCPACGDTICVDEDMLDEGEINCPGCGERLEFDFDFDGEIDFEDAEEDKKE